MENAKPKFLYRGVIVNEKLLKENPQYQQAILDIEKKLT